MELDAFQRLADLLPEPMLIVRPDGAIRSVNRAFTSSFGWRRDEVSGTSLHDLAASPPGRLADFLRHCAATSGLLFGSVEIRQRDGSEAACRAEGAALRDVRPSSERLVLLRLVRKESAIARFVDLTQQLGNLSAEVIRRRGAERRAAAALESERGLRDRLAALAEASRTLVASLALDDVLRAIGELAVRLVPADAYAVWYRVSDDGEWRTVWHQGLPDEFAAVVVREDGSAPGTPLSEPLLVEDVEQTPMLVWRRQQYAAAGIRSLIVIPLHAGAAVAGTVVAYNRRPTRFTDDDRRVAVALGNLASSALATTMLYEAESKSRMAAQAASRVKDEFLATLSHELRTPLNAVLGYARMIRAGALEPDKEARALEVLERNATSLTQIVEDILDVSRIVAGKIRLNVGPVDLAEVISEAADTVRPAAEAKGIELATQLDPLAPLVTGDPDRLQQVLWNVLLNAVKFTPRRGRVDVRLEQVDSHVQIVVSDTGAGISREFLPHLFEPFRQADSGFSRQHGGLGLGLSIARHIVEMHGGRIEASSDGDGQGATFRVQLPVMAVRPAGTDRQLVAEGGVITTEPRSLAGQLSGIRVFVVDDDADARMLIADILQTAGAEVLTAESASAALRRLEGDAVPAAHVLLTDIGMPGMDGLEMMVRIRRSPQPWLRELPAIALTAYARSEDRLRALESGCQKHVSKPISPEELVAAIRSLTRGTPAAN